MTDEITKENINTDPVYISMKGHPDDLLKKQGVKIKALDNGGVKLMSCAGMDVHKKILVISACITDPVTFQPTFYVYRTTVHSNDVKEAASWLKSMHIIDVAMESSGKYWYGPFKTLEEEGLKPVLTHPKYVKTPKGKKNDVNDAMHIANCFRMGMVTPSFVPPADIRDMRELCRYRMKLVATITQEKNRYQNGLTACNIRLDNVFSDVFGSTCQRIMDIVLNSGLGAITIETLQSLLTPKCKSTPEEILNAIKGGEFVGSQQLKLKLHKEHIDSVVSIINQIDEKLKTYADKYRKQIDHIMTIEGIKETAAIYILAEIGPDMTVWKNMDSFANWAGVVPASNSSAGKHKSTRIGKGGYYLKPVLVQCALAASMSKKEPYFSSKYENYKSRCGHKKAVIAVAHKMICSIYAMLSKDEDFHPSDYYTFKKRQWKANRKPKLPWAYSDLEELMKKNNIPEEAIKSVLDTIKESSRALPVNRNAREEANTQELEISADTKEEAKEKDGDESDYVVHARDGRANTIQNASGTAENNGKAARKMPGRARNAAQAPGNIKEIATDGAPSQKRNSQEPNTVPLSKKTGKRPGRPKKAAPVAESSERT